MPKIDCYGKMLVVRQMHMPTHPFFGINVFDPVYALHPIPNSMFTPDPRIPDIKCWKLNEPYFFEDAYSGTEKIIQALRNLSNLNFDLYANWFESERAKNIAWIESMHAEGR